MAILKTMILHRRQALRHTTLKFNSLRRETVSSLSQSNLEDEVSDKKPLLMMFGEAVGVKENRETIEHERYMIKNLKKLEKEICRSEERIDCLEDFSPDEKITRPRSLSGLFRDKNVKRDQRLKRYLEKEAASAALVVLKKLSEEMMMFIEELYKGGYFYDANFLPGNSIDASYFDDSYSREYIKFAADRFANDHQEIAKWLSGSQVKTVALNGCPTLIKKNIFAAKRLQAFFRIQEDTVCSRCVLRESCQFVNQSVWNGDSKNLKLDDTLRVVILYALEAAHPKLSLPEHFKATVNLLLRDIINLSKTTS
ncbi:hypothetical protein QQ045_001788 [Rhodiola kirilowii]